MQIPLQISFRDVERSEHIEAVIRKKVRKLELYFDRITACRVVVFQPHRHHIKGNLFAVSVEINVPGDQIAVTREPANEHAHEDLKVTIRDAFEAARRQLSAYVRKRRQKPGVTAPAAAAFG